MTATIIQSEIVSKEDQDAIIAILQANNVKYGYEWASAPLSVTLKNDAGLTVGGLVGSTNWGWLHVELLAVDGSMRGRDYGSQLLIRAEQIALKRGCRYAFLDTFSFQARGFYEKHGYEVYGVLDDFPAGACRFFLKKDLATAVQHSKLL